MIMLATYEKFNGNNTHALLRKWRFMKTVRIKASPVSQAPDMAVPEWCSHECRIL